METFIPYILKVNIALTGFFLLYALLLKKDTFLVIRRYFFLSAILFSCFYPFVTIHSLGEMFPSRQTPEKEVVATVMVGEPVMAVVADETPVASTASIPWKRVFHVFFVSLSAAFALRFMWQFVSILRIRAKSEKRFIRGIPVYHLSDDMTPFSFFNWIFIHTEKHSAAELSQILLHEQTHARQWHSVDILLIETLCVLFWWNPFLWLMKREMAMNLEYLADNGVLREGVNSRDYQYHLLRLAYQQTAAPIVNNFNVSQLKQRIMMMNKMKSPARKLATYLYALPLVFLLLAANSAYSQNNSSAQDDKKRWSKSDEVFVVVEKQPEFPGGGAAMMKFLSDNIKYPVEAQKNGLQGRVIANFVIEKDGSTSDVQIVRGVGPLLDAEAVRIIKEMPKWQPGEQKNQIVRVRFTLPVVFRLQGKEIKNDALTEEDKAALAKKQALVDEIVVTAVAKMENSSLTDAEKKKVLDAAVAKVMGDEVFVVVEDQPEFPGGMPEMMKFLNENIRYPKEAQEKKIQGRVICNFVIEKDGSISEVQVVRSVDPLLDTEAVRVLQSMPNWKPGLQRGNPVRVRFTFPVVFSLQRNTPVETTQAAAKIEKEKTEMVSTLFKDEDKPQFPGGEKAYMRYLGENVRYPVIAQENGVQGLVRASYAIDKDGNVINAKIVESVDPSLDKEVLRIIESMPKWENKKQFVSVISLPVVFRLQGDNIEGYKGSTPEDALVVVGYGK